MIGYGSVYPVAFDVFDASGALVNATTVTLTITLPDGTTVTPAVTNPPAVTGKYRLAYQTTMAGRHTGHAVTSGPVTVYDFEFDVDEAAPPAIVSLDDTKQQLNIDPADTSDDDELRAFIYGTTAALEEYLHETVVRRTVTDQLELPAWCRRFRVWSAPVISIVSAVSWDGAVSYDTTSWQVSRSGRVLVPSGPAPCGLVNVAYLAGYQVMPYNYRRGALVMLQHLWENQRGVGTFGSGVIGPEERYRQPGEFFTIPNKAKEWLGPPRPVMA